VLKVNRPHLLAVLAAFVLVAATLMWMTLGGSAAAQSAAQPQVVRPTVALLDVTHIFRNHARLKAGMDRMKQDVLAAEASAQKESEAISGLNARLKTLRQGSQDYKALEAEIARRQTELVLAVQNRKREFVQEEARLYYNVYHEIQQEVDYYCSQTGTSAVLNFSREPVDLDSPDSILACINRPVIAHAANLDITDLVLSRLNQGSINPAATQPRPGVSTR
jgi:Skp family chaperone for outer membrane proteins